MEFQRTNPTVRKAIGVLDIILTGTLIILIFCYSIHPHLQSSGNKDNQNIDNGGSQNAEKKGSGEKWLAWLFLALFLLCAIIPILAAIALIKSTSPNIGGKRILELTRFWMHCNIFTIIVSILGFGYGLVVHTKDGQIVVPVTILNSLLIRALFTFLIWKQLNTMSPTLIATLDPSLVEEKRSRLQEIRQLPLHQQRMQPEYRASMQGPSMPLRPYFGKGLNIPKCQCTAPQC